VPMNLYPLSSRSLMRWLQLGGVVRVR